ncbi:MAG: hypothetical protein ABI742_12945 [Gemmatimonadota bacterium]
MRSALSVRLLSVALVLAGTAAPAALLGQSGARSSGITSDAAVALRLSTLGVGFEVGKLLTDHLSARVGINFGSLSRTGKQQTDITYDVHLKLKAFEALVDFYPSKRGVLHFTAGLLTNPVTITGDGQPSAGGTFTINNHTYTSAQVGKLRATGKFPGASPYVGLGFGTPANRGGRVTFLFDLGVGIGKPTLSLTSTGAASDPTLQADLDVQRDKTQKDLDKVPVYPVLSLGVAVHF